MQKNSSAEGSGAPWTQISRGVLLLGKSTVDTTIFIMKRFSKDNKYGTGHLYDFK